MVVGDFAIELDTVVIGAGPGGYVAAIRAAEMGQKVAIIEREYIGGVCLNVGCIPSKALIAAGHHYQEAQDSSTFGVTAKGVELDFAKTQDWKDNTVVKSLTGGVGMLLKKHKVEIIEGGRVLDSTGGLNLKEVPKKFVIIGGGVIGAELGGAYANLGSEVTILEGSPSILPTYEKDMVKVVTDDFKKKNVTIVTSAMAKEAVDNGDSVTVKYEVNGKEESVEADYVMVTVGRRPNTDDLGLEQAGVEIGERGLIPVDNQGRTNVKNIFAIGDIVPGAALAHKASYEAKIAAEAISGKKVAVDYKAMPAVAFTDPELASVGMTVAEAKEAGIEAKGYKFPFAGNGRAISLDKTEGFMRLVTTVEDNVIIGAQIAGVGASDMISELALAIESGMNAEDIALTIHPHPSLGEITMDTAELALGLPIHI